MRLLILAQTRLAGARPSRYIEPMNIENLPRLPPVELGYCLDASQPVIPLSLAVARAGCHAPHQHPRGQLLHASEGLMWVIAGGSRWLVPPAQALWLPPEQEHQVFFPGQVTLRNLFVHPDHCTGLPSRCQVLQVSPLLRALLLRAVDIGSPYPANGPAARLMQVLLDELAQAKETPLQLPFGSDARLLRVQEALLAAPGSPRRLADWAQFGGCSPRTLARLFSEQTGLSFGSWRQRLCLQSAIERLQRGDPVTTVALDLGYDSPSAFGSMFKRALGCAPGTYSRR